MTSTQQLPERNPVFVTTQWSAVCAAGNTGEPGATDAMEQLCRLYWPPLYAHVRRRGYSVEDAQDLTQEFFTRTLQGNWLSRADQSKGRFRTFLLTALDRFLANDWDKHRALKRGGGVQHLPLQMDDAETRYGVEPADTRTPEQLFEYTWALILLQRVMDLLLQEFVKQGEADTFHQLKGFIIASPGGQSYSEISTRLGVEEGALRVAVHRLRTRYRELLRNEIARTVDSLEEVDSEMHHLYEVLRRN